MNTYILRLLLLCILFLCAPSCNQDDTVVDDIINEEPDPDPNPDPDPDPDPDTDKPIFEGDTGNVLVYDEEKIFDGYVLVNDASDNRVYLMTKEGKIRYEWELPSNIGNDAELLENGKLLVALTDENAFYDVGGFGGRIQIINPDRSVEWDFLYSTEDYISHHDIEMLPNGNVLILAWQKRSKEDALQAGYDGIPDNELLLLESLIEVNPENNDIVWEWYSWDHIIQDFDDTKDNFGDIAENPQLIDLNFHDDDRGDIMHANGLDYDPVNDLIYLSVNFYSEVWVIDHSTTTEEAATNSGGNYNKGGDLVYRFGNPLAYKNETGTRLFYNNHFPNYLDSDEIGAGNLLIYMNGNNGSQQQSHVYELNLPDSFTLLPENDNEPTIEWEFTDAELYSPIVSGAVRLPNGNTLIAEGRYGYWEVTESGEVVWLFEGNKLFWRGYSYPKDHPGVLLLELN